MNYEHSSMAMNAISHAALMVQHSLQQVISEYGEPSVIYKPKLYMDGNSWCALYGDDIQSGCCGFGKTPADAMRDFNLNWFGRK